MTHTYFITHFTSKDLKRRFIYKTILKDDGEIHFKTDNRGLFDFSVEEFKECNWKLDKLTYDLHNSEYMENNVMTEYEKRFSDICNINCMFFNGHCSSDIFCNSRKHCRICCYSYNQIFLGQAFWRRQRMEDDFENRNNKTAY